MRTSKRLGFLCTVLACVFAVGLFACSGSNNANGRTLTYANADFGLKANIPAGFESFERESGFKGDAYEFCAKSADGNDEICFSLRDMTSSKDLADAAAWMTAYEDYVRQGLAKSAGTLENLNEAKDYSLAGVPCASFSAEETEAGTTRYCEYFFVVSGDQGMRIDLSSTSKEGLATLEKCIGGIDA